jgi:hypothetical protein
MRFIFIVVLACLCGLPAGPARRGPKPRLS